MDDSVRTLLPALLRALLVCTALCTPASAQTGIGRAPAAGDVPLSQSDGSVVWTGGLAGLGATITPATDSVGIGVGPGLNLTTANTPWIITGTASSPATDGNGGLLAISKHTSYGTPAFAGGAQPALYAENSVEDGVWNNTIAIRANLLNKNTQHSQPGSTASAVPMHATGFCLVAGCTATWGAVIAAYDMTGQSNPSNGLIGLEIDNYAHGTDNNQLRVGLQIVSGIPDAGAANVVGHGILMGGQYINLFNAADSTAVNGINLNGMTITGQAFLSPGFNIDGTGRVTIGGGGSVGNALTFSGSGVGNLVSFAGTSVNGINLSGGTFSGSAFASPGFVVLGNGGVQMTLLPTSAGGGGLTVCVDTAGVLYKKATCP